MKRVSKPATVLAALLCTCALCSCAQKSTGREPASELNSGGYAESDSGASDGDISSDTAAPDSSVSAASSDGDENGAYTCRELADIVYNCGVDFPDLQPVTDPALLEAIMDFSAYGISDYFVYQQMISVQLNEIIILKASDKKGAEAALEERKKALIEIFSFYPEQEASAQATVVGSKGDICWLIAHVDAKTAEKALLEHI